LIIKPASTRPNDMSGVFTDRTELRCGMQGQLIEGERLKSLEKPFLIGLPALIKREKRNPLFSHSVCSFLLLFSQTTTKSGEKLSPYRTNSEKCSGSEDQFRAHCSI